MSRSDKVTDELPDTPFYPAGTARALLDTDLVTPRTRAVLSERLDAMPKTAPHVLDETAFEVLRAMCALLIPQPERANPVDLAGAIDDRLAKGEGNGWRYAAMPPDADAYRLGLRGMDECALSLFGSPFTTLDTGSQEAVLRAVQHGEAAGEAWHDLPAARFFEELLAELVESYYSHPMAMDEIGYAGFADAHGWQDIGLDRLAPHEPHELGRSAPARDGNRMP